METMMETAKNLLSKVVSLLPTSPFAAYTDKFSSMPYLKYINYFIPISDFIVIGEAWLVAIGLFYLYSIVLRWIRAID